MGGMGGITEALGQLLGAAGLELSPWTLPSLMLIVMGVLLPRLLRNMNTSQARKYLRRSRIAEGEERAELEAKALGLVDENPAGLLAVAEEALRINRKALARDALGRLRQLETIPKPVRREARRVQLELEGDALGGASTPEAFLIHVEKLVENGMLEEARRKLGHARRRWPSAQAVDEAEAHIREAV